MIPCGEMQAARVVALVGLFVCASCLDSYELSLGGRTSAATRRDAGVKRDAGARGDAAVLHCSSDDDCAGSALHICDANAHVCYECNSDSDCQERPGFPHCNPSTRACEGCVANGDCQNGSVCDRDARTCTEACTTDADCTDKARPSCQGGLCKP